MAWWSWGVLALVLLALAVAGLSALGARRWAGKTRALAARLDAAGAEDGAPAATHFDPRELEGLPAPVQRYFRAVLGDGQALIDAATIDLAGRFNLSATGRQWRPFRSRQRVRTRRPGFLWDARIALLPGLPVRVVDGYIAGQGLLQAAALGLFTVAEQRGEGEIAHGEFMRFFAEAAWYPSALLPSQGVQWAAVDERSAQATMCDGPLALSLLFRFGEAGLIDSFRAEARSARLGDKTVVLPWEGRWSDYRRHQGLLVPFKGEVAWIWPEGRRSYFQGQVSALQYRFRD